MSNAFFVYTLQHQFHWAMVGAIDFMDGGRLYLRNEAVGNDDVVDAPTGVLFASVEAV